MGGSAPRRKCAGFWNSTHTIQAICPMAALASDHRAVALQGRLCRICRSSRVGRVGPQGTARGADQPCHLRAHSGAPSQRRLCADPQRHQRGLPSPGSGQLRMLRYASDGWLVQGEDQALPVLFLPSERLRSLRKDHFPQEDRRRLHGPVAAAPADRKSRQACRCNVQGSGDRKLGRWRAWPSPFGTRSRMPRRRSPSSSSWSSAQVSHAWFRPMKRRSKSWSSASSRWWKKSRILVLRDTPSIKCLNSL